MYKNLTNLKDLDFEQLLKSDFEIKICKQYLFTYENLISELKNDLLVNNKGKKQSLNFKVNTAKLLRFMVDLSSLFSKYYSKIHILEVN